MTALPPPSEQPGLLGLLDRLHSLPSDAAPDELRRARIVAIISLAFALLAAFFAVDTLWVGGFPGIPRLCAAGVVLFGANLLLLWRLGPRGTAVALCIELTALVFAAALLGGGRTLLFGPWNILLPLLAIYLLGPRRGLAIGAIIALECLLFFLLERSGLLPPQSFQLGPGMGLISMLGALTVILAVGGLYEHAGESAREGLQRALEHVQQQTELYEHLLKAQSDMGQGVALMSGERIVYANDSMVQVCGCSAAELQALPSFLDLVAPEDRKSFREQLMKTGERAYGQTALRRKDGAVLRVQYSLAPLMLAGKEHTFFLVRDITQENKAAQELFRLANYDLLTGLPSKPLFLDRMAQASPRPTWHGRSLAVMLFNLDRFKWVNDTLGHAKGDALLRAVGQRLASCIRSGDTLCRLGGDEFAILLADIAQPDDAAIVGQKILDAFVPPFEIEGQEIFVSLSAGISLSPGDAEDAEALLTNAETAMYRAKDLGGNRCQLFSQAMNQRAASRLKIESALRRALDRQELFLAYQPLVDLAGFQIVGMEALIRWKHPVLGSVPPSEFIPIAEDTGFILPLGEWILRTACEQIAAWKRLGLSPPHVAVNLSARQFQQGDLLDVIRRTLEKSQLDPHSLGFELTESTLVNNVDSAERILRGLREMGAQVSLDDFGTGYSSLSYLKRFSFTTVKIDQSFVRSITTDPKDRAIARSIIELANGLGLSVLAEAVETQEQLLALKELGCQRVQGYLFSKPVPADEAERLLRAGPLHPATAPAGPTIPKSALAG